ncbi:hypothetical protein TWF481_000195 [Arthrobotrys musiformis]|uniref:Uncharacterized protein n=1 Tax=Arthrobotrys musiformis TaxID=47236 RepID=A0AAV9WLV8_9PEZI
MLSLLSVVLLTAIFWTARMAYNAPSPQRRSVFILSTLILVTLGSSFLNPFAAQAVIGGISTLSHQSASGSSDSSPVNQVPHRKTEHIVNELAGSNFQKHTFITKYHNAKHLPSTLILTATDDDQSWGRNEVEADRSFLSFLDIVTRQQIPPQDISIGLLTSDLAALMRYNTILLGKDIPVASVEIIYAPDTEFKVGSDPTGRSFQPRNALMGELFKEQEHVIWIDPDIFELPEGLFQRFYRVAKSSIDRFQVPNVPKKKRAKLLPLGIVTVLCRERSYRDLARNAYTGPSEREMRKWQEDQNRKPLKVWPRPMSQIVKGTSADSLVRLDGVGETVLYIRGELVRKGLKWPIGDDSKFDGLCPLAKDMGWGCYGLGGTWETKHTDF